MIETGTGTVMVDDGTALWTTVGGHGQPVVLCHGGPGLWDYLEDLADLLAGERTAVRYDQRGCGRSGGLDGPFTLERAVADLDQLRSTLGVERWAVLGHSWGADLALRYAVAHPERATAVVYVGGVGAGAATPRRRSGACSSGVPTSPRGPTPRRTRERCGPPVPPAR